MQKLPVDFEGKVKTPPPPNGAGYPYQISAKDLMANFDALKTAIDEIEARLDGATIEAECSEGGHITVTLTI